MNQTELNSVFPDTIPAFALSVGAAIGSRSIFDALGGANLTHDEYYWDKDPPYNQSSCKCDGCHPDDLGYAAMADVAAALVREAAGSRARARIPQRRHEVAPVFQASPSLRVK